MLMQILEGIKVSDVTQFISGSRCTQILADMGAEVVKVEPPQGDTMRMLFKLTPGAERNYSVLNHNKYAGRSMFLAGFCKCLKMLIGVKLWVIHR